MRGKRYPKEFKIIDAKQKVNNGHSITCLVARSSISTYCFYSWIKVYGSDFFLNKV